jgi:hypothetical protein
MSFSSNLNSFVSADFSKSCLYQDDDEPSDLGRHLLHQDTFIVGCVLMSYYFQYFQCLLIVYFSVLLSLQDEIQRGWLKRPVSLDANHVIHIAGTFSIIFFSLVW